MMALNKSALIAACNRGFSVELVSRSGAKLAKALENEVKYENDNYSQLEDIETFLNESGFVYSEQEDGVKMSLTKTLGDKKIEILFEAR
jgi:(p)ppGpp synthase/HD superfamily hydrolase